MTGLDPGATYQVRVKAWYTDNKRSKWSDVATGESKFAPNVPAAGQPTISGTTEVGEKLTAGTSSIDDGNGLSDATFTYQWIRSNGSDTDIEDATNSRYTLVDADAEATITVRVSFTDDDGYPESVTSDATVAVTEAVEEVVEEDDKAGSDPRDHQALPWDGHTVHDAKAWVERHIQNAGDSVWLSLSGEENHYYWWYYYDDHDNSLVPNPKMQFYNSDGTEVVLNGYTVEDELGSGERRFNLPSLRLMPDADDTYYMKVSSTSNGTGKFWVYYGHSSITSSIGDRNGSDCRSGIFYTYCQLDSIETPAEGYLFWSDRDSHKITLRRGDVARACANFPEDPEIVGPSDQYGVYDDNGGWLFIDDVGTHCTDYFTAGRTANYSISVMHLTPYLNPDSPGYGAERARNLALPGHNYTVWYEYQ